MEVLISYLLFLEAALDKVSSQILTLPKYVIIPCRSCGTSGGSDGATDLQGSRPSKHISSYASH